MNKEDEKIEKMLRAYGQTLEPKTTLESFLGIYKKDAAIISPFNKYLRAGIPLAALSLLLFVLLSEQELPQVLRSETQNKIEVRNTTTAITVDEIKEELAFAKEAETSENLLDTQMIDELEKLDETNLF